MNTFHGKSSLNVELCAYRFDRDPRAG
jgi:hypothetical protein